MYSVLKDLYFYYSAVHNIAVMYRTILHYTTLHYTTLHYTTLHYTKLHYTTLHYTTLHYTTLHYTTLHYTTLHYTTLHYTTLHYTTVGQCVNSHLPGSVRIRPHLSLCHKADCSIYHTLSIWLEMEYTSNMFLKMSVRAN